MKEIIIASVAFIAAFAAQAAFNAIKTWYSRRKKKPKQDTDKAVREFSKVMIKSYSWACILWITASYILAAFDKPVNDGVTIAVVSSLAAVLLGYFLKSCKENIKKNGG